jgi:hypothetical protein
MPQLTCSPQALVLTQLVAATDLPIRATCSQKNGGICYIRLEHAAASRDQQDLK